MAVDLRSCVRCVGFTALVTLSSGSAAACQPAGGRGATSVPVGSATATPGPQLQIARATATAVIQQARAGQTATAQAQHIATVQVQLTATAQAQQTAAAVAQQTATATTAQAQVIGDHLGAAGSYVNAANWIAALREYNAVLAIAPTNQAAKTGKDRIARSIMDYINTISTPLETHENALIAFTTLLAHGNPTPASIASALAGLNSSADALVAVPVPPEASDIGATVQSVRDETYVMTGAFTRALRNSDRAQLQAAIQSMTRITDNLKQVSTQLQDFTEQLAA